MTPYLGAYMGQWASKSQGQSYYILWSISFSNISVSPFDKISSHCEKWNNVIRINSRDWTTQVTYSQRKTRNIHEPSRCSMDYEMCVMSIICCSSFNWWYFDLIRRLGRRPHVAYLHVPLRNSSTWHKRACRHPPSNPILIGYPWISGISNYPNFMENETLYQIYTDIFRICFFFVYFKRVQLTGSKIPLWHLYRRENTYPETKPIYLEAYASIWNACMPFSYKPVQVYLTWDILVA